MPPLPPFPTGTEGKILLVEEYQALGAALAAALRKYAPGYSLETLRSLADAGQSAALTTPQLIIVDFDPPLGGVLRFLKQMRESTPATPVLFIVAGIPPEVIKESSLPRGATFLEKPFALQELGAVVENLLRSGEEAARSISALALIDVIPLLGLEAITDVVEISVPAERLAGEIHFAHGRMVHAAVDGLEGVHALREMLRWRAPEFVATGRDPSGIPTIEGRWAAVLTKALRSIPRPHPRSDASAPAQPNKTAAAIPSVPPVPRDGKKVLVIDDTDTLLDFVEQMLTAADPRLQIFCAANGTDGLQSCLAHQPDLILLDYSLPDLNGDEVCARLLADETTSRIPVIMMSGHIPEMASTAARFENVVHTLAKPFVSAALIELVLGTLAQPPKMRPRPTKPSTLSPEERGNGHQSSPPPPASPPPPIAQPALTPAHIPVATTDAVVLNIPLEVIEMKLSPDFRIISMRARPSSPAVILHVDPRAVATAHLPDAAFQIAHIDLDPSGQMGAVRIVPAPQRPEAPVAATATIPVAALARLPAVETGSGIQITPTANARMIIQLLAAFDLAGVQLSPTFGVSHFALRARGGKVRAILPGHAGSAGITFAGAQVLLDASAKIAEVSLDAVVP